MTDKTVVYKTPCIWIWVSMILFSGMCGGVTGLYTGFHAAQQSQQVQTEAKTNQVLDKVATKLDSAKIDCPKPPPVAVPVEKPSWFHWWNGSNKH